MNFSVDIGLLWAEPAITGELLGEHAVQCRMDCCRYLNLANTNGRFEARAANSPRTESYGIRLAEMFSQAHAEKMLTPLAKHRPDLDLDILEAGKKWDSNGQMFDNRVWWPVVKAGSRNDAEQLLCELRDIADLDPLGMTVVRLDQAEPHERFEFSLGEFSAQVLEVRAVPLSPDALFRLNDVPIGRGFHWQRKEPLDYRGIFSLFHPGGGLTAINRLPLETYLESAVGSEMRSDLPPAFSQAQAICARSTVLATANRHHRADGFDVCNDDHCQCYQGTKREANAVIAPVRETAGQILIHNHRVVDARYAKSCGGVSERYEAAWGQDGPDYFAVRSCGEFSVPDLTNEKEARRFYEAAWGQDGPDYFAVRSCGEFSVPDLTNEKEARRFLDNPPHAWCNPSHYPYPDPWDKDPLFRWRFNYTRSQLGALIEEKTGISVGDVREIQVIRRGQSGRILILDVIGSSRALRLYGELNIRRALSPSHLPSSYFVTELRSDEITLIGGGWGHGVGLCQLGACAMARANKNVVEILQHYYPGAELQSI